MNRPVEKYTHSPKDYQMLPLLVLKYVFVNFFLYVSNSYKFNCLNHMNLVISLLRLCTTQIQNLSPPPFFKPPDQFQKVAENMHLATS